MRNLFTKSALLLSALCAGQAFAADMECYVDTQAYDKFTIGSCAARIWGGRSSSAVFRVVGANKDISSVIWGDSGSSCGTTEQTSCIITIRATLPHKVSATILYSDGTWEKVAATAELDDGR